jgi:hypothetical protein
MDLGAVVGVFSSPQFGSLAVDVLPDPHAAEAVAALNADAAVRDGLDEVAYRTMDFTFVVVDPHLGILNE